MTSRPSFQFYPADWRANAKLRRCSPAARGVWIDVMCLLHDGDDYGVLRWTLKEIAQAAGASMAHVKELVDKGVLKGWDKGAGEPLVYIPRSGRKCGDPVTLIDTQPGPLWYSSRMVKDEYVRTVRGQSTRFGEGDNTAKFLPKSPPNHSPKGGIGDVKSDGSSTSSSSSPSGIEDEGTTGAMRQTGEGGDLPKAVIAAFDAARVQAFGEEFRRPNPAGKDRVFAQRFLADGFSVEDCAAVFHAKCQRMAIDNPRDPPNTLEFMKFAIADAVSSRDAPLSKGKQNDRKNRGFDQPAHGQKIGNRPGNGFLELRRELGEDAGNPDGLHHGWDSPSVLEGSCIRVN